MKSRLLQLTIAVSALTTGIVIWGCAGIGGTTVLNQAPLLCATETPSITEIESVEAFVASQVGANPPTVPIVVPIYFHIITDNNGVGDMPDSVITQQMAALNAGFAGTQEGPGHNTQVSFVLAGVDRTANSAWYTCARDTAEDRAMKTALRQGSADDVNVYVRDLPPGIGGWGGFPWWYAGDPIMDGPEVDNTGMPGQTSGALGDLVVHEVGHWIGLYHTFQGGCDRNNDLVSDTPAQEHYNWNCPTGTVDTCTGNRFPGTDPTMNFMDYTADSCKYQFTKGQSDRIQSMWKTYRKGK